MLKKLLSNGYFPKELPPCFKTTKFADVVFPDTGLVDIFNKESKPAKSCVHNLARAGSLPRKLVLVNPIPFSQLANCIASNWGFILSKISRSNLSLSMPSQKDRVNRAIVPKCNQPDLIEHRARVRVARGALLKSDISQFYPSLYTHSIPWAIHGKKEAKATRDDSLLGNKLDRLVRNGQDGQTLGIPVGPDTSLVLAEIVTSAVDEELQNEYQGKIEGFRYYDDYELVFDTSIEAEWALDSLQKHLGQYELVLNPRKTEILNLPCQLEATWVHKLRTFIIREGSAQRSDLIHFFETVFDFAKSFPDEHVVKYALTRLYKENLRILDTNWPLVEKLLFHAMMVEPGGIPAVARVLLEQKELGRIIDGTLVGKTFSALISKHGAKGNTSEVSWALWASLALNVRLDRGITKILGSIDDSVVAILSLDVKDKGLLEDSNLDLELWEQYMCVDELYGSQWLLSYEGQTRNWFKCAENFDTDEAFSFLKNNNVSFYETVGANALASLTEKLETVSSFDYGIGGNKNEEFGEDDNEEF
ncbi:MAG: RNA-directed DNA polymerase [Sedimentisphaerales bacterium]